MRPSLRFTRVFLALCLLWQVTPASADPGINSGDRDVRGSRYGEVLVVDGRPGALKAHVYCTMGLNDCPDALWKKLDATAIKKQWKAWAVVLNGPRYFLMNRVSASRAGTITVFGGLQTRELATVDLPRGILLEGLTSKPYAERAINRTTEYVFKKGNRVYELVSGAGNVYMMQSYALIKDPTLTEAALKTLGARLALPKGWTYRTRVLDADLHVRTSGGQAHVVQDDLDNTYQRVRP